MKTRDFYQNVSIYFFNQEGPITNAPNAHLGKRVWHRGYDLTAPTEALSRGMNHVEFCQFRHWIRPALPQINTHMRDAFWLGAGKLAHECSEADFRSRFANYIAKHEITRAQDFLRGFEAFGNSFPAYNIIASNHYLRVDGHTTDYYNISLRNEPVFVLGEDLREQAVEIALYRVEWYKQIWNA